MPTAASTAVGRTLLRLALAAAIFLLLDLTLGSLAHHFLPYRVDDGLYRVASPVYHHDLRPGFDGWGQWGALRYRVRTNSLGFKDASPRDVPLDGDRPRILLIGDSFTEGVGYAFEDTFAGRIHAVLGERGIEVLNAGVVSYAPSIYYRKVAWLLEDVGLSIDEVVVFLDISDIHDEGEHYEIDADGRVVDQSPEAAVAFHPPRLSLAAKVKQRLRENSLTAALADRMLDRLSGGHARPAHSILELEEARGSWTHEAILFARYGRRGLARAAAAMDRLHALLEARGLALTVVVYPWPYQILAEDRDSRQVRYWRDWCARRGVQFVDLFPAFFDGRDPREIVADYFIAGDLHFNEAGNRLVADRFLEAFRPAGDRAPAP